MGRNVGTTRGAGGGRAAIRVFGNRGSKVQTWETHMVRLMSMYERGE